MDPDFSSLTFKMSAKNYSGFISQRHGSADPGPHQNVMDPQHWLFHYNTHLISKKSNKVLRIKAILMRIRIFYFLVFLVRRYIYIIFRIHTRIRILTSDYWIRIREAEKLVDP